jgi:integrase
MRSKGPNLYKQAGSANWHYRFRLNGPPIRGSTGTDNEPKARRIAAEKYREAVAATSAGETVTAAAPAGRRRMTLDLAFGAYWSDRGEFAKTADDIRHHTETLIAELGADTLIRDLSFRRLSDYIARRRMRRSKDGKHLVERANASINRELTHLRTVLIHARDNGEDVPRIEWAKLLLPEPDRYQTILSIDAEAQFLEALRPDFWPIVDFGLATGLRLENILSLRWPQIDWHARTITVRGKSKTPGGKLLTRPITERVAAILGAERGRHPDFVFTYECERNRHDPHSGTLQKKGERYPFTQNGWRRPWDRARRAIGLPKLRFHDLRHTFATRMQIAGGDLPAVKEALGHSDISVTMRYAGADMARVREAQEAAEKMFARRPRPVAESA